MWKSFWNRLFGKKGEEQPNHAPLKFRWGSYSETGPVRDNNEDRLVADSQGRFFMVADGMGGQSAGERASEIAADIIPRRLTQNLNFQDDDTQKVQRVIGEAVGQANSEILALGEIDPALHSMGTTVVLAVVVKDMIYIVGVGDSRVYRSRGHEFVQLTKDHSLTAALLDAGTISEEDAETHRWKHVLLRYLGSKEGGQGVEPTAVRICSGDRLILCSDGVTDGLKDKQISDILQRHADPQQAAKSIVESAIAGGSRDNTTCITIYAD